MKTLWQLPQWVFLTIIGIVGVILFIPFIGSVHLFDWDEINFAESAREMVLSNDYTRVQINFHAFWEKPPLFIWLQALAMNVAGITEFAARIPNVLVGAVSLMVLAWMGIKLFDRKFAIILVLIYAGSLLPHFYFRTAIIDPLFNLFIFLGIFQAYLLLRPQILNGKYSLHSLWAGIFIGLAIITKGPVALLVFMVSGIIYYILNKRNISLKWRDLILFVVGCFIISTAWFGYETYKNGFWFIKQFINYQIRLFQTEDAGHGGPLYYHWIVLLIGCFPASIFFLGAFGIKSNLNEPQKKWLQWNFILFFVHLILFSIVKTKIVHYSSLCYFPLCFGAAYQVYQIHTYNLKIYSWQKWIFGLVGVILTLAFIGLPYIGRHTSLIIPLIKDEFAVANLGADVHWPVVLYIPGLLFGAVIIYYLISKRKDSLVKLLIPFIVMIMIMQVLLISFVPRIEQYSQASMIEFYKSLAGQDVYVTSAGFKSYGQYYYTQRQLNYPKEITSERLLDPRPLDKPAYIVTKIQKVKEYPILSSFTPLGVKNGYAFFKRDQGI